MTGITGLGILQSTPEKGFANCSILQQNQSDSFGE